MGSFKDDLATDMKEFTDVKVFGEAITYIPDGDVEVDINAVVERDINPEAAYEAGLDRPTRPPNVTMEVTIANDATTGRVCIVKKKDQVIVALSKDKETPTVTLTVVDFMAQDEGAWRLLCQA